MRVYKDTATRFAGVVVAWEKMRAHKQFFRLTPEQFRERAKTFTDACEEILDLESRLARAVVKRDAAEPALLELLQGVVNSVKGDPDEGQNGELYAAMGYVPKNQRSTGLKRRAKGATPENGGSV
jgi:hypothetical protein